MRSLPRWARRIEVRIAGGVLLLVFVVAAFPWGPLVGLGIGPLSRALGREVTIGSARRVDFVSFVPTIELTDVTVGQPAWIGAGPGPMARIARVRLRFPVLPLLIGRFHPHALDIAGLRLELRRDAQGRSSWDDGGDGKPKTEGGRPHIAHLTIADGMIHLIDARRHVALTATLASDAARGLVVAGRGTQRGRPMTLAFHGAALGGAVRQAPYPVRLAIASPLARLDAVGTLVRPLDLSGMTARVRVSGTDLKLLDDYIQAGLFPTAPYALAGRVWRDRDHWKLTGLAGRIGRTELAGAFDITRPARTVIAGRVAAKTLDFDDFTSAEQRARGAAQSRAIGPHVLPTTRIVLGGLAKIDADVRLDTDRLLSDGGSPFRTLHTTAKLASGRLTLAPLAVGLTSGRMTGRATIDDSGRTPKLALDLTVTGATVQALFVKDQAVTGPFEARIRLTGTGDTVRAALGRADGRVGFAVPSGSVRRDYATFLGGDVLRSAEAAIAGSDGRVAMRCLVGIFPTRDGVMTPAPLVLDNVLSRGDGSGRITLADERIDLVLHGRSKHPGPLVSTAPVRVFGTLSAPQIDVRPPRAEATGKTGTLARIGFFLKKLRRSDALPGRDVAPDADCGALVKAAMR